eukprot:jgi/Chrzof1/2543/Cz11g19160.t1
MDFNKNVASSQAVPHSGITVVKKRAEGDLVYQYDAAGNLIMAPDCYKQKVDPQDFVIKAYSPTKKAKASLQQDIYASLNTV